MGTTSAVLEDLTAAFTRDVAYGQPGPLWASLHDQDPGPAGTVGELTTGTGAFARQQVSFGAGSGGLDPSNAVLSIGMAGGGQLVSWLGLWTAQTGGTFLGGFPLVGDEYQGVMISGSPVIVSPGHPFVLNDVVRLFPGVYPSSAVPTGLVEDQQYWVVAVPSPDGFEISATEGGSPIAAVTSGAFVAAIDQSGFFSASGTFNVPAGNLQYQSVSAP
jgi:hypothetical protein